MISTMANIFTDLFFSSSLWLVCTVLPRSPTSSPRASKPMVCLHMWTWFSVVNASLVAMFSHIRNGVVLVTLMVFWVVSRVAAVVVGVWVKAIRKEASTKLPHRSSFTRLMKLVAIESQRLHLVEERQHCIIRRSTQCRFQVQYGSGSVQFPYNDQFSSLRSWFSPTRILMLRPWPTLTVIVKCTHVAKDTFVSCVVQAMPLCVRLILTKRCSDVVDKKNGLYSFYCILAWYNQDCDLLTSGEHVNWLQFSIDEQTTEGASFRGKVLLLPITYT